MKKSLRFGAWSWAVLVVLIAFVAGVAVVAGNAKISRADAVPSKRVRLPADVATVNRGLHLAQTREATGRVREEI